MGYQSGRSEVAGNGYTVVAADVVDAAVGHGHHRVEVAAYERARAGRAVVATAAEREQQDSTGQDGDRRHGQSGHRQTAPTGHTAGITSASSEPNAIEPSWSRAAPTHYDASIVVVISS